MAGPVVEVQVGRKLEVRAHHQLVVQVGQVELDFGVGAGEVLRARVRHLQGVRELLVVDDDPALSGLRAPEEVQAAAVVDVQVRDHHDVYVAHLEVQGLELLGQVLVLPGTVREDALQSFRPTVVPLGVAGAVEEDVAELRVLDEDGVRRDGDPLVGRVLVADGGGVGVQDQPRQV